MEKDWKKNLFESNSSIQRLAEGKSLVTQEIEKLSSAKQLVKHLEDNSTSRFIKELNRHSDMIKILSQPISDLARINVPSLSVDPGIVALSHSAKSLADRLVMPDSELTRLGFRSVAIAPEMLALAHSAKSLAEAFVIPTFSQIESLIEQIQIPRYPSALQEIMQQSQALESAMKSMQTPWLNSLDLPRSVLGFSELQNMGSLVRSFPSFDDRVVDFLRTDLGDWRDPIDWPENIFDDPSQRSKFYEDQGLNSALTDFPVEAFHEGLSVAGFFTAGNENDPEPNIDDSGLARTRLAFERLQRFEIELRIFISNQMAAAFGESWVKHKIPGDMRSGWETKRAKAVAMGEAERPIIEYADFTDYQKIIERKDNWDAVFGVVFKRPTSIQESLQRLYPIRICTMHARIVTKEDELYLWAETTRIFKAIGIKY